MKALLDVIMVILDLYWWIIIISAIFSWLYAFNVINAANPFVANVSNFLYQATEPVLRPIRRVIPNLGSLDISPIIVLLIIIFLQSAIVRYAYPNVF